MERNELCWCGSGKKYKKCHMPIEEKIMMHAERGEIVPTRKILKTPFQIEKIRKSAELNTAILDEVARQIHIGMSTQEIDDIVCYVSKSGNENYLTVYQQTINPKNKNPDTKVLVKNLFVDGDFMNRLYSLANFAPQMQDVQQTPQ